MMLFARRALMLSFACLALTTAAACASGGGPEAPRTSPPGQRGNGQEADPKPYDEVITDEAVTDEGLFTVHKVDEDYFFEIPDSLLGKDMLLVTRIAQVPAGLGGFLTAGVSRGEQVLRWERHEDAILLRKYSFSQVAADTLPIYESVVINNFAPILASFDVETIGPDSTTVVIDVTSFYGGDTPALAGITQGQRSQYQVRRLDPSRSFINSVRSYPLNVDVRHTLTYEAGQPPSDAGTGTISMQMHQSMVLLPLEPMKPRLADDRVGYFSINQVNFGLDELKAAEQTFIRRWRLEPSDPAAYARGELVEPVKPIEYYIDPATPARWRPYVRQGVEDWNAAFESAGFRNAVRALDPPSRAEDPDWHPEDARYSVVRWAASMIRNAMGPSVSDPRTGEIIESDIVWFHNHLRSYRNRLMLETGASNPAARSLDMDDDFIGEAMRQVIAHEVGHALGLPHNMIGSSSYPTDSLRNADFARRMGVSPSVMDYARQNYVAQPGDGLEPTDYIRKVGPYDHYAIEWGYRWLDTPTPEAEKPTLDEWILARADDPMYRFGSSTGWNPDAQTEDMGDDPVRSSGYGIANLQRVAPNLVAWTTTPGEGYDELDEIYGELIGQWSRYVGHVLTLVGGRYQNTKASDQPGPIYTPVSRERQEGAVQFVIDEVFETPTWLVEPDILRRIEHAGALERIRSRQVSALNALLDPGRLQRLIESEVFDEDAYPLVTYLDDVKDGVWSELDDAGTIDTYRRNLQRAHLERLEWLMTEEPPTPPAFLGNQVTRVNVRQSDIRPLARAQLAALRTSAQRAAGRTSDRVTRAHLEDVVARIDLVLEGRRGGSLNNPQPGAGVHECGSTSTAPFRGAPASLNREARTVAERDTRDPFGALRTLDLAEGPTSFYDLRVLEERGLTELDRLPFSIRVLLENALRHAGKGYVSAEQVQAVADWSPTNAGADVPFMPSRVVLQDFTGVPAVVDLAAMRNGLQALGGDPQRINPVVPADLVIDHSVQVDYFGTQRAYRLNVEREYERNGERYALLRWAQQAFENFSVVPPGTGIVHQVNLEYLAAVVHRRQEGDHWVAYPDTLVGTDSHTTMINGLGVVGWGVGGIEAEAVLMGQPYYMLLPEVVGMKLTGELPEGATATDLVLRVTEMLRAHGVVGRFVEYYGAGLSKLSLPDKATLGNMSPEYGATIGFFPVDDETLLYLKGTARQDLVERVERVSKELGLFRTDETPDPEFTSSLELDLSTVEPSVAGPKRPQDRIALTNLRGAFDEHLPRLVPTGFELPDEKPLPDEDASRTAETWASEGGDVPVDANGAVASAHQGSDTALATPQARRNARNRYVPIEYDGKKMELGDGSIVIAAITSCTNTSNPSVMVGAGLVAKKAIEAGLDVAPWVKTSMAPGSKVVTDYLESSGLLTYLEQLHFDVVGYGCTTCIGNSGPLPEPVAEAVQREGLVVASILSGNRNFEARIHPLVRGNYLASPMLVVAFALAGRIDIDLYNEPLGHGSDGKPVFLADIWPSQQEIRDTVAGALDPAMFVERYGEVFEGDDLWRALPLPEEGGLYEWNDDSTYIRNPPFFEGMSPDLTPVGDIAGARVLALLGESVTTDHISPAGAIGKNTPAGRYLQERGVKPVDFNTYGSRRGNHEVMMRGTFANVRIRNQLLDETEGGYTIHFPSGEETSIYEAAMRYQADGTPLVVLAGKEYGAGSSRDWAAKGTALLGVKAVIARSYERIHRSNLVGMGVLPLQFHEGDSPASLELTGRETFDITGVRDGLRPGGVVQVEARGEDGSRVTFEALVRLDSDVDVEYYLNGGILHTVLRKMGRGEM